MQDNTKIPVLFLLEKDSQTEVFAFFPELPFNNTSLTSYSHVGQHSACCMVYAGECKKADPSLYADLKSELEGIGYDLEILN